MLLLVLLLLLLLLATPSVGLGESSFSYEQNT
jgi:hypothetical protein